MVMETVMCWIGKKKLNISEKWQNEFDYVNYMNQCEIYESLAARDLCRCMVVRHEAAAADGSPFVALGKVFENDRANSARGKLYVAARLGKNAVCASVWGRRANEIALKKEKEDLIREIQSFQLRVAAASLSRDAVNDMQSSLIRTLRQWPCDHWKQHIFTKADFVHWIKKRCNLPPTVAINGDESPSLAEAMASSAEAAFVEHVLNVLPSEKKFVSFQMQKEYSVTQDNL